VKPLRQIDPLLAQFLYLLAPRGGEFVYKYIFIRLINAIIVVCGVSLLVFVLTRTIGNPVDVMLPIEASIAERVKLTHQLGLDKPFLIQLWAYFSGVAQGDFGLSWWQRQPALTVALERLPATFLLLVTSFLLAFTLAVPLGVLAAIKPKSLLDKICSTGSLLGVCLPNFWLGLMLIIVFAVKLGWFYTSGYGTWRHLVLPAVTLSVLPLGRITQMVRSAMLDQLQQQYIVTARSKGLAEWVVVVRHALKNAGVTIVTISGWELGRMMAGYTVVIEVVFGWPGLGQLVVESINQQDFPLLQALTFVIASIISLLNLVIDLTYPFFDPRIKYD